MHITQLTAKNYKTLKDFTIPFNKGFNVIIGENNTGKSNVLNMLNKIVNEEFQFNDEDVSKIENSKLESPSFSIKYKGDLYEYKNKRFKQNKSRINTEQFKELINSMNVIHLNITDSYGEIINNLIDEYNNLDEHQKNNVDTQINIDFQDIIGDGNHIYIKDDFIYVIDQYGDNSKLNIKSNGIQRIAIITLLLAINRIKKKNNNYILLIDEPETNLHVKAQRMIHKLLLEFSQNNQIIISTHSTIFMQELNDQNIKYVRRDNRLGTYIDADNVGAHNYKKIRESLGLEIRDTLLLNERIIAVEGEYDVILHEYIFNRVYRNNRRYSFLSIEGADNAKQNIITLKQILSDDIVIILDNDVKGNSIKEKIEGNEFIKTTKVLFQPLNQDGELEDLFNKEFLKSVIEKYINSNQKYLKKHFNGKKDEILEEYTEQLKGFTCFSEIEKIGSENNEFSLKNKKFYKRIIRTLNSLSDEEFNEEVKNIKKIYEII